MYYNKLFGLEFLTKTLKHIPNVTVLPWRVYRRPKDFDPKHFPNAKRLLVRTNLEGDIHRDAWIRLPRSFWFREAERPPRETLGALERKWRETASTFSSKWKLFSTDTRTLHFIVHGVPEERNAYLLHGRIFFADGEPRVGLDNQVHLVWRGNYINFGLGEDKQIQTWLSEKGLTDEQAASIANNIANAVKVLSEGVKKEKMLKKGDSWEASFAILKSQPTGLEFFDFLHLPKR